MSDRLTRKFESVLDIYEFYHDGIISTGPHIDKLGQLEDIEEEFGIDLITLFKALTNGIYVNVGESIIFYPARELRLGYDTHYGKGEELCILKDCGYAGNTKLVSLTNYRVSWALTKEELQ